ncbi:MULTISPECIES: hypothetical protein [unclassified Cryobacterium]|uniref:hypothetical protein n=1 Tax=unclassified Cryobacterium TaxID=2649013 RepID=UPI001E2BA79A|nr:MULTISPECIES: hypothetical protein [unclassified Cryobacterium]
MKVAVLAPRRLVIVVAPAVLLGLCVVVVAVARLGLFARGALHGLAVLHGRAALLSLLALLAEGSTFGEACAAVKVDGVAVICVAVA